MKKRTEFAIFDCPHPTIPGARKRYRVKIIVEEPDDDGDEPLKARRGKDD